MILFAQKMVIFLSIYLFLNNLVSMKLLVTPLIMQETEQIILLMLKNKIGKWALEDIKKIKGQYFFGVFFILIFIINGLN